MKINQTYGHGSGVSVEKTTGEKSLATKQSRAEQVILHTGLEVMDMKVFALLLLFAVSCEFVSNPSDGLKDKLHRLAVKNSGNRI